jgi:paraquat-inducible protein B
MQAYIPVFFETYPEKFREIGPEVIVSESAFHHALVSKGLRAQLQMQSLVTGQLVIDLDFHPDTTAKLHGVELAGPGKKIEPWWEVPTIQTPLQRLESALEQISFKEITEDVRRAMDGIAKLAASPDLHASIGELRQTMIDIQKLVRNIDSKVEPLATGIDQTLVEARAGIGDARKLITNIDKQTTPLMLRIQKATDSAKNALEQADTTLKSIEDLAEEGSKLRYEVSTALREVGAASRSVRVLADFIEQHPDALLRGRAAQTGGQ